MAFTKSIDELIKNDRTGLLGKHPSWERVKLSLIVSILNGAPFESSKFSPSEGTPLIRIRDLLTGSTETFYTGEYQDTYLIKKGDLLIGMDGDFNSCLWNGVNGLLNQRVCKVTIETELYDKKLVNFLLPGYLTSINEHTSSVTVKHLSSKTIGDIDLPLPPRKEQTRIVEKLEELLPQLDAGMAELQAAQKKLKQYRQSLLKAAVEGQLTADWRKRNVPTEDGAQLLQRILSERRARWEAKQLAKFNEQGKKPPKGWQDKYPEPARPDTANLPELPEGWVWASLDMLGDIVSGVTKGTKSNKKTPTRAVPYLRVANVQRGYLDLNEVKSIEATEKDISELALNDGDVLFNEGGDRDKLGRGWVWRNQIPECIHQNHVFRFRSHSKDISPELISHHGNTFGKLWFQNSGKQTTNLASINITILKGFPIPVSPLDEQRAISDTLRSLLSDLAYQDSAISEAASLIQKQRQNILRAAFAGELVPQDPNDEPASELLARIAAERAAKQASKRTPAERNKATAVEPSGTKRRKRKEAS